MSEDEEKVDIYTMFPILYMVIGVSGAIVNLSVFYRIFTITGRRSGASKRECYRPVLILAAADFAMLSCLLIQLEPVNNHIMCKVLILAAHFLSALRTICWTMVSLVRYIAIYQPFRHLYTTTMTLHNFQVFLMSFSPIALWFMLTITAGKECKCEYAQVTIGYFSLNRIVHAVELSLFYTLPMLSVLWMDFKVLFLPIPRNKHIVVTISSPAETSSGRENLGRKSSFDCSKATRVARMWLVITTLSLTCNTPEVYAELGAITKLWTVSDAFLMWARLLYFTQFVFTSMYLLSVISRKKTLSLQNSISLTTLNTRSPITCGPHSPVDFRGEQCHSLN